MFLLLLLDSVNWIQWVGSIFKQLRAVLYMPNAWLVSIVVFMGTLGGICIKNGISVCLCVFGELMNGGQWINEWWSVNLRWSVIAYESTVSYPGLGLGLMSIRIVFLSHLQDIQYLPLIGDKQFAGSLNTIHFICFFSGYPVNSYQLHCITQLWDKQLLSDQLFSHQRSIDRYVV